MKAKVQVSVKLKPGVLDAEGKTVEKALDLLGVPVDRVQYVKTYNLEITRDSEEEILAAAQQACDKLLANPVVHDYSIALAKEG